MREAPSDVAAAATRGAEALRDAFPSVPSVAVVFGSGLGALEDALVDPVAVPFEALPGLPAAGVAGHSGRFVHGRLGPAEVLVQAGRFHVYEGHPLDRVVAPVRILSALGVGSVVMTNAAGGIRPGLEPGDVVLLDDVMSLMFRSPLAGPVVGDEARFPDMSRPFDPELLDAIRRAARDTGIRLEEGTYAAVTGPAYETAAEIRMLARLGADVVGMSTVPEMITAAGLGLSCAVLSLVTNRATGLSAEPLSHEEVLEVGRAAGERVAALLTEVAVRLARRREDVPVAGDGSATAGGWTPGDGPAPERGAQSGEAK